MMKNIILLALLTWVTLSYAKDPAIVHEHWDAQAYKVEKPSQEKEAERSLAGSKIKKKKGPASDEPQKHEPTEGDSEVRYWQYSE